MALRPPQQLLGQAQVRLGTAAADVVLQDRTPERRRLGEPHVARDDRLRTPRRRRTAAPRSTTWCESDSRSSYSVSTAPSIASSGFHAARTRSSVRISSLTPSRAKYSHWIGISTASAAASAFSGEDAERRRAVDQDPLVVGRRGRQRVAQPLRAASGRRAARPRPRPGHGATAAGRGAGSGCAPWPSRSGRQPLEDLVRGGAVRPPTRDPRCSSTGGRGRSAARSARRRPRPAPRLITVVVLPTPPFWFATAITR